VAAAYFVDSSALVKRYVQETGTSWVRGITRHSPSTLIYIARITAVEVPCAIARRRKGKTASARELVRENRRNSQDRADAFPVDGALGWWLRLLD
jgi:predicted nucleic acid-binding protein